MVSHHRLFLIGLILLFVGLQLRMVKTVELNDRASQFIEKRFPSDSSRNAMTSYVAYDPYVDPLLAAPLDTPGPSRRSFSPPPWLGLAFISVGAVLVLTSPRFR